MQVLRYLCQNAVKKPKIDNVTKVTFTTASVETMYNIYLDYNNC